MRRWRSRELAGLSCCAVSRMMQRTLNHRHASHFMAWITTTRIPRPLGARSKSLLLLPATKMEICTSALFLMASRCLVIQTAFAVVWLALRRTERANSPPPLRCPVIVSSRRWLIIARPHYPRMATRFTWQLIASPSNYALSLPSTFGWDDTASVVPVTAMPFYLGPSSYLLLTKYNNYVQAGGNGRNYIALIDPNVSMRDPITGVTVMKVVRKILGPTANPELG